MLATKPDRGFSLIELLVAIAISVALMMLALPAGQLWIANTKVRTTADALQNGLRMAQAESLRRDRLIAFYLSNNSPTGPIASGALANGKYWGIQTVPLLASETAAFVQGGDLGGQVTGTVISGPAGACFNSLGFLASIDASATKIAGLDCTLAGGTSALQFNISHPQADRPLRVVLKVGGQIRLCDPAKTLSTTNPDGC